MPMKYKFYTPLIVICLAGFLAISCSNLSKNIVQDSDLFLKNGTFADKTWKEDLVFQRTSWYHELTLQLDLMMAPISPRSSFNFWLSKDELENMVKCGDSRVVLAYSLDTKDIPYSTLYDQFEKSGFTRFEIPEFKKQLLQHPDSQQFGFRLYHIFAICKKLDDHKPLIMNFPGYSEKTIK
jgi:hypothetical protein